MAETEILRQGEWDSQQFRATGAMLVEVLAPAELQVGVEVDGLAAGMRSRSPRSGAFPLQAVPDEISVLAVSPPKAPFSGGARVDLSVSFPSVGRSFMIQNLDIAGQERAPLVRLTRDGDMWILRPQTAGVNASQPEASRSDPGPAASPVSAAPVATSASGASQDPSATLGSWSARRAAEIGVPVRPQVTELLIDTSASMTQHRDRVERLCGYISALARATGMAEPRVSEMPIGTSAQAGVGSVLGRGTAGEVEDLESTEGRRVVITDLPVLHANVQSLVIGDPAILEALSAVGAEAFILDEAAWVELGREDVSYTDQTVRRLEPLMRWLALPAPDLKEHS